MKWLIGAAAALALCGPADPTPARADPGAAAEDGLAEVRGTLRRRGIRGPAIGVEVRAEAADGTPITSAFSDVQGRFVLALPPGPVALVVDDVAYAADRRAVEVPAAGVQLVPWGLTPSAADDGLRVYGRRPPGTATLDGEALRTTAGTLGDPLRAVQSLPSVGTILTLVPFPIVRGSAPGETAIRVDGTPIPLLFHSGVGQGVVPSVLVDHITLHTSGAPVDVGQHVSAIEVTTSEPDAPGLRGEALLDLVQAGALVSAPIGDGHRITAAGRIGYPGWILSLLDQPVIIDFADYNLRYTWRSGRRRVRVSLFGATDRFGDAPEEAADEPALTEMAFHRLALRWIEPLGDATLEAAVDLGLDRFDLPEYGDDDLYFFRSASGARLKERSIGARLVADVPLVEGLALTAGVEQRWRRTENAAEVLPGDRLIVDGVQDRLRLGAWLGATLTVGPLRLVPGVRLDLYDDPLRWAVDPRLDARLGLGRDTALVGRIGRTQGPQRYPYPIPGIGEYAAETRLHSTVHGQIGVEQALDHGLDLRWTVFGQRTEGVKASPLDPVPLDRWSDAGGFSTFAYGDARAWGSELLLRRRAGGWIDGWLSYTVQRVERRLDDPRITDQRPWPGSLTGEPEVPEPGPWASSLLEQQHLLNGVLTLRLPAGWTLGARLHYTSGRPRTQTGGDRLDGYAQLDARVEYTWVGDLYTGSAWLDVINVTHAAEPTRPSATEPAEAVAYTLPMLGVRARF